MCFGFFCLTKVRPDVVDLWPVATEARPCERRAFAPLGKIKDHNFKKGRDVCLDKSSTSGNHDRSEPLGGAFRVDPDGHGRLLTFKKRFVELCCYFFSERNIFFWKKTQNFEFCEILQIFQKFRKSLKS